MHEGVGRDKWGNPYVSCICSCGNIRQVSKYILNTRSKSCGCLRLEQKTLHGFTKNSYIKPEIKAYYSAKYRCNTETCAMYENYGGRGIEFRFKSFEEFYKELGNRPAGMSLDRINNDGHYEIGNVRWATTTQQAFNKRRSGPLPKVRTTQL